MKRSATALTLMVLFLLCAMPAQAIPVSYGIATHRTTEWQELATYENGTLASNYGVFWSVDNGETWGQDTNLLVGQEVQFMFNMHKENVGTHYSDFLKSWVDWGQDGKFDEADVIAFHNQELLANESGNLGSYNDPRFPDYTFYSGTYLLTESDIGYLYLRSRVTCSDSLLAYNMGQVWDDQWDIAEGVYNSRFNPTGWLNQGEVEEWKITVNSSAAPVPEPATMILLGTGLFGLVGFRRKNK
jgi:hypothetical protein